MSLTRDKAVDFRRGQESSKAVQIDHVVALGDAWQKGAQQLTPQQRQSLANDPVNLIAADGPANQQKSAGDAATWLPKNKTIRCHYVARQISVKAAYGLWVTQPEKDAMKRVLDSCPDQSTRDCGLRSAAVGLVAEGIRIHAGHPGQARNAPAALLGQLHRLAGIAVHAAG